jgi:hypothetical protein
MSALAVAFNEPLQVMRIPSDANGPCSGLADRFELTGEDISGILLSQLKMFSFRKVRILRDRLVGANMS